MIWGNLIKTLLNLRFLICPLGELPAIASWAMGMEGDEAHRARDTIPGVLGTPGMFGDMSCQESHS